MSRADERSVVTQRRNTCDQGAASIMPTTYQGNDSVPRRAWFLLPDMRVGGSVSRALSMVLRYDPAWSTLDKRLLDARSTIL